MRSTPHVFLTAATATLAGVTGTTLACGHEDHTLRELVEESELVFRGTVQDIQYANSQPTGQEQSRVAHTSSTEAPIVARKPPVTSPPPSLFACLCTPVQDDGCIIVSRDDLSANMHDIKSAMRQTIREKLTMAGCHIALGAHKTERRGELQYTLQQRGFSLD